MFEKQYTTLNEKFWLRIHRNAEAFSKTKIYKLFSLFAYLGKNKIILLKSRHSR